MVKVQICPDRNAILFLLGDGDAIMAVPDKALTDSEISEIKEGSVNFLAFGLNGGGRYCEIHRTGAAFAAFRIYVDQIYEFPHGQ